MPFWKEGFSLLKHISQPFIFVLSRKNGANVTDTLVAFKSREEKSGNKFSVHRMEGIMIRRNQLGNSVCTDDRRWISGCKNLSKNVFIFSKYTTLCSTEGTIWGPALIRYIPFCRELKGKSFDIRMISIDVEKEKEVQKHWQSNLFWPTLTLLVFGISSDYTSSLNIFSHFSESRRSDSSVRNQEIKKSVFFPLAHGIIFFLATTQLCAMMILRHSRAHLCHISHAAARCEKIVADCT